MTNEEFESAITPRMEARARDAAHMILVEGLTAAEAARRVEARYGEPFSRQAANRASQRIEASHAKATGAPEGWECVTVLLPPKRAAEVREIERQARREAGLRVD